VAFKRENWYNYEQTVVRLNLYGTVV